MKKLIIILLFSILSFNAAAQRFSVSTNLIDWANYGTVNAEFGISVAQHLSIVAGAKYNGWDFSKPDGDFTKSVYNKNIVGFAGLRFWPWYVNSGLWIQVKGQYADYQIAGTWLRPAIDQGRAVGAGLSTGYTIMINKSFNIELGLGGWGGYLLEHNIYGCTREMEMNAPRDDSGPRPFIDLDNITAALVFVF